MRMRTTNSMCQAQLNVGHKASHAALPAQHGMACSQVLTPHTANLLTACSHLERLGGLLLLLLDRAPGGLPGRLNALHKGGGGGAAGSAAGGGAGGQGCQGFGLDL